MNYLTEEQKKKINEIADKTFAELEKNDQKNKAEDDGNKLDSGQGNSIISKYKKQIEEIINGTQK